MDMAKLAELQARRIKRAQVRAPEPRSQEDLDNRLLDAAGFGLPSAVGRWLALGADPEARDTAGLTPLMAAALAGCIDCARELLPASDPWARDRSGRTAMDVAGLAGHEEIAEAIRGYDAARRERAQIEEACGGARAGGPRRAGL